MSHQGAPQITSREEERVLGISYERAIAMIPRLAREAIGVDPVALGDGYFVAKIEHPEGVREVTIRLGRQGPDTRFSVGVDTLRSMSSAMTVLVVTLGVVTIGLGILFFLPWLTARQRREGRARHLLIHQTFRAIEDAVAEQGAAGGYRIGPGADAATPEAAVEESVGATEAAGARAR